MSQDNSHFAGKIRVAARIIDYLSSGLYHTPAACLKELINNSYDASATSVNVFVKPDANRIIIEDDGDGMSRSEFERHFSHISESHKRDTDETVKFGRRKIGKIGIGFIAANEICDRMEIYSTQAGSTELLHVSINFDQMRLPPEQRRIDGGSEFVKADYEGEILEEDQSLHYTRVFLTNVRGEAARILAGAMHSAPNATSSVESLYGLADSSIASKLRRRPLRTWTDFDAYSLTMLQIGLNVPVRYHDNWMPPSLLSAVRSITEAAQSLHFSVYYDNTPVHKPIVFPDTGPALVETFSFEGAHVSATGYFYVQHGTIAPQELHGLLLRIRNAAVGEYDPQFWGFPPTEAPLIQRWVSAEVYADDRLESAMNIDRRTLRVAHPAYAELQRFIHDKLRQVLKRARQDLYQSARETRRKIREKEAYREFIDACRGELADLSPNTAAKLEQRWTSHRKQSLKMATQKLTIVELYELVVSTAMEVLDAKDARRFIDRLTEKLFS